MDGIISEARDFTGPTEPHEEATATPTDLQASLAQAVGKTVEDLEARTLQKVAGEVFRVLHEAGLRVDMVELARFEDDDEDRSRDLFAGSNGLGTWASRGQPLMSREMCMALG